MRRSTDGTAGSRGMFYKGVALGATVSVVLLGAQAAFAGTGVGGVFNLGRSNSVGATTTLTGKAGGAQLQVTNKSTGAAATGVSITVDPRRAPLKVNSRVVVPNLNSSFLQGKRAADFLGVGATAANASKLGGRPASDYLLAGGTAADAAKLGGKAASEYVSGCPLVGAPGDPALGGVVSARATISGGSGTLSASGVIGGWSCSGGQIWVQRAFTGGYCVVVDPTTESYTDGDWTYYGYPTTAARVAPVISITTPGRNATVEWGVCGPQAGIPGNPQYIGYFIEIRDATTSANVDAPFTFALL